MGKQFLYGNLCATFCAIGIAAGLSLALAQRAHAQSGQDDFENIESLFSKGDANTTAPSPTPAPTQESAAPAPGNKAAGEAGAQQIHGISDLGKLDQFSDIAVIQKRYLPKTGRFEAFGGLTLVTNDAFFLDYGVNGRLAYYFRERYGVELLASYLTNSAREVTQDLQNQRGIATTAYVTPVSYYGIDFKWTPIYGKMTWRNRVITPFDLYFSIGAGETGTNQGSSPTLHIGTGQIFAKSKSMAWRWDFSWNMFESTTTVNSSSGASLYNNLLLSLGASFYFPEATYR